MSKKIIPIVPLAGFADARLLVFEAPQAIYVRAVTGWFSAWRWALVWLTQAVFYGLPWLSWNGRQAVLFNLESQRFYLFGLTLYPHDLIYLTVLLVLCALALFFFTAVAGRLWCGFACPQTVYTEIFLWIERRLEGDHHARKRLDGAAWSLKKVARKSGKHFLWLGLSLWTGFTFVGYFTPIQALVSGVPVLGTGPWEAFWILFYGVATYANAGYLREQVCKHMCPYARFQGAMFDRDTLIIGYDAVRGEARGSRARAADARTPGLGDCIDCTLCVQVCPTGIDIRNGLQSNCIGCAACIDVCDSVMDKMNYPRGLIRYSTQNGLQQGWDQATLLKRVWRARVLIYGVLLLLVSSVFVLSLHQRSPFRIDVIRDRGVLAREVPGGAIENVYRLHIMNATELAQRYRVGVLGLQGLTLMQPASITLGPMQERMVPVSVRLSDAPALSRSDTSVPIQFEVRQLAGDAPESVVLERTSFQRPR